MCEKYICYIDILGFSNYILENEHCDYAVDILNNVNFVLNTRIIDQKTLFKQGFEERLNPLIERTSVDTFDDYLALSDSVFITSNKCNLFIKQISTFLMECFLLRADRYRNPEDENEPTRVTVMKYDLHNGEITQQSVLWYPILFRGGISFGEVIRGENYMLCDGAIKKMPNLIGKGVVRAVNLEKSGKGPHLFIDDSVEEHLSDEMKQFVWKDSKSKYVLWPVFHYIWENEYDSVLCDFKNDLAACINLWKAYRDRQYSDHYYKLVKLIIQSFFMGCEVYYPSKYNSIKKEIRMCLDKMSGTGIDIDFSQ